MPRNSKQKLLSSEGCLLNRYYMCFYYYENPRLPPWQRALLSTKWEEIFVSQKVLLQPSTSSATHFCLRLSLETDKNKLLNRCWVEVNLFAWQKPLLVWNKDGLFAPRSVRRMRRQHSSPWHLGWMDGCQGRFGFWFDLVSFLPPAVFSLFNEQREEEALRLLTSFRGKTTNFKENKKNMSFI